jgi:GLPGLI family protein
MSVFQKTLSLFFISLFIFSTQFALAQKKLKSGVVIYEIVDVQTSVPELKLMKGINKTLYFSPEKQKIDIILNNETIKVQTIYNSRSEDVTVYYDFINQHFKVRSNIKNNPKVKPFVKNILYQKSETKTIAGYQCYKAEIVFKDEKLIVWLTDKIKINNPDFKTLFPGLEGFPLEYTRRSDNAKMIFRAKSVSELLSEKSFQTSNNYIEISEKEFNERMGGMKFGF